MRTRVRSQTGPVQIDLHALNARARGLDSRCVTFPVVIREARENLLSAMWDRFGTRVGTHELRRMQRRAEQRLGQTLDLIDREDPAWDQDDITAARRRFKQNKRDLSGMIGGRPKDAIPDAHDLQIMVQANRLDVDNVYLFSNDVHFWGYGDLLEKWWDIVVHKSGQIPSLLHRW